VLGTLFCVSFVLIRVSARELDAECLHVKRIVHRPFARE
jgi:hypothetical protein